MPDGDLICVLCENGIETVGHIYFSCTFSWITWCNWINEWGLMCVFPAHPQIFLLASNELLKSGGCHKVLLQAFFLLLFGLYGCCKMKWFLMEGRWRGTSLKA